MLADEEACATVVVARLLGFTAAACLTAGLVVFRVLEQITRTGGTLGRY